MDESKPDVGTRFGISAEQDPRADPAHPEHEAWLRETEEMIARQRDAKRA